jgi:outer membrane protein TolC
VASNLFNATVTVKQPIYTSGKVRNAIHLAHEAKQEKQYGLDGARQQITFRVFRAFHDMLLAEENQQVVEETRQQLQKHLELARTRFSQGTATEIDVLRSSAQRTGYAWRARCSTL